MRLALATLGGLILGLAAEHAAADQYAWCAEYGGRTGGSNCYFVTLAQCQAAVSGVGGFCRPSPWYTGPAQQPRWNKRRGSVN
jgi:hypothetical protein